MVKYFTETFVNRKENFSKIKLCKISVFVLFFHSPILSISMCFFHRYVYFRYKSSNCDGNLGKTQADIVVKRYFIYTIH